MEVIARVDWIGKAQEQPSFITFQDRHGQYIGDTNPEFAGVLPQLEGVVHDNDDNAIGPDKNNTGTNTPNNIEVDPPEIEQEDTRELEDEQPITVNNEPTYVNPIIPTSDTNINTPV